MVTLVVTWLQPGPRLLFTLCTLPCSPVNAILRTLGECHPSSGLVSHLYKHRRNNTIDMHAEYGAIYSLPSGHTCPLVPTLDPAHNTGSNPRDQEVSASGSTKAADAFRTEWYDALQKSGWYARPSARFCPCRVMTKRRAPPWFRCSFR